MACKTLLVGLGSKGSDMVSRAVDRIVERHGSLAKVPWVRVVAIDTAPISGEPNHEGWRMAATENVINIGLDARQYSAFTDTSDSLSDIDYLRWGDKEVFSQAGASVDGAGGVRMIGRGSLLHSASMTKVHEALKNRLDALTAVNLPAELTNQKLPPLPQGANPNIIRVFVCGALTGGTSSGSFIDVGYLIQAMGGYTDYQVYGIFALPHPECGKPPAMANAYVALRELNHFLSDGVRYRQRIPLPAYFPTPIEPPVGTTPYRGAMLVMARSGVDVDIPPMHESVAEFLYASSCSNVADSTFQKIVDPAAQFRNLRIHGVHARFQTFGSSSLVFPAEHIARGASSRLVADAFEEWLAKSELPVMDALTLLNGKGFTLDGLRTSLTQPAQSSRPLRAEIEARLDAAVEQAIADNLDYRQVIEAQIEDGFASERVVDASIGPRVVPQTIDANRPTVIQRWFDEFKRDIDRALLDLGRVQHVSGSEPDRGLNYAIGYCKGVLARIAEIRKETTGSCVHTAEETAQSAMEAQWSELEKANSKLAKSLGWAKGGRQVAASAWGEAAKVYWRTRVDGACGYAIKECLTKWEEFVKRTLIRLHGSVTGEGKEDHNPHCLKDTANALLLVAQSEFKRLDSHPPRLNGTAIFTPGQTILSEHAKAMSKVEETDGDGFVTISPSRKDEEFARAWIIRAWDMLSSTGSDGVHVFWATTDSASPFDPPTTSPQDTSNQATASRPTVAQLDNLVRIARGRFYKDLFERDVLSEVYGHGHQNNAAAVPTVTEVIVAASPFLDIHDGPPLGPPTAQDPRTPSFAFYFNAPGKTFPYLQFGQALQAQQIPEGNQSATLDPTRATILRTRTTFPAVSIDGIDVYAQHEANLKAHEGVQRRDGRSPYEARKDIVWKTLDGSLPHDRLEHRMALFLFGLAIQAIKPVEGDYEVQTQDAGRRLEPELEKAGFALCTNMTLYIYLHNLLEKWAEPHAASQLAAKINDFLTHCSSKFARLEYRGEFAGSGNLRNDFEDLLLALLEQEAPDALAAYDSYLNDNEPRPRHYLLANGGDRIRDGEPLAPGYYCNITTCQSHLGDIGNEQALPSKCPVCGVMLFKPGWYRRWNRQNQIGTIRVQPAPGGVDMPSTPDLPQMPGTPANPTSGTAGPSVEDYV